MYQTLDDQLGLQFVGNDAIWDFSAKQMSSDPQTLVKQTEIANFDHARDALSLSIEFNSEQANWATRWSKWIGKSSGINASKQSVKGI